nr:hypothetical protein [Tanacetum cinerariifolium]
RNLSPDIRKLRPEIPKSFDAAEFHRPHACYAMSSFFTLPGSQKKRKRQRDSAPIKSAKVAAARKIRDESISGSDDEEDE